MLDLQQPLVSVCVPAYNYARFVGDAVQSLMAQTYANLEILILNNASTDATGDICSALAAQDGRIRLTHWTQTQPATASHNYLLEAAQGEFIAIASADDLFYADKIARQVAMLQAQPELGAAFCLVDFIDADSRSIAGYAPTFATPMRPDEVARGLLDSSCVCMPANLLRRSSARAVGLFDSRIKRAFDYDYWMRLVQLAPIGVVPAPLMAYRIHGNNTATYDQRTIVRDTWQVQERHSAGVLQAHPSISLAAGAQEDKLAQMAMSTADWRAAERFLTRKIAAVGLSYVDAMRLSLCLLEQNRSREVRQFLTSLLRGQVPVAPRPQPQPSAQA